MSFAGYSSQNHPRYGRGVSDVVDDRATPPEVFGPLQARFGFTLDVCAAPHNAKCARYFTADDDGLAQSWAGETVWCNPPYSRIAPWVVKAWLEYGRTGGVVMLLPATRTEQGWWHDLVEPYRDRPGSPLTSEFLPGRVHFLLPHQHRTPPGARPMFGCCLLVWTPPPRPAIQAPLALVDEEVAP